MKTLQETLDIIAKIAKTHQGPSLGFGTLSCRYRGNKGLKCLIGELIPDDLYTEDMEDKTCDTGPVRSVLEALEYPPDFCKEIQDIHDQAAYPAFISPEEWQQSLYRRLHALAVRHKLILNW